MWDMEAKQTWARLHYTTQDVQANIIIEFAETLDLSPATKQLFNTQSLINKSLNTQDHILDRGLDFNVTNGNWALITTLWIILCLMRPTLLATIMWKKPSVNAWFYFYGMLCSRIKIFLRYTNSIPQYGHCWIYEYRCRQPFLSFCSGVPESECFSL